MNIKKAERSFEACTESGWFGYNVHLERAIDDSFVHEISSLGEMTFLRQLKKPFFVVRSKEFLIRGVVGNSLLKVGIPQNDPALLDAVLDAIKKAI